jgi:hypothetical protein
MRSGWTPSVYFVPRPTGERATALTETLTESFCERCGTRYEFSAPTRLNPLRKTRGLIGGLKNYLTSQDALSDAINDAMRDETGQLATAQLDAFHEAFNFCIDCRQYTCLSCWNEDAGRCRTCVPIPGRDDLAARIAGQPVPGIAEATMSDEDIHRHLGMEAWPTHDLPAEEAAAASANGHAAEDAWATTPGAWAITPPTAAAETTPAPGGGFVGVDGFVYETQEQADAVAAQLKAQADAVAQAEADAAAAAVQAEAEAAELAAQAEDAAVIAAAAAALDADPTFEPEPEPVAAEAEPEPEPVAAEAAPEPHLHVVAWDEDATIELEPEPVSAEIDEDALVAAVPEPEPEPVAAETPSLWPETVEPEPVAAEVEPEPESEPIAAAAEVEEAVEPPAPVAPRIAPISETILRFPQRPAEPAPEAQPLAAQDDSPEAVARRAQLDELGLGDPGDGPLPSDRQVLPYRSRGAAITQAEMAMRAAAGQRFWEASAREVASAVGHVGVQNCGQCGLSLSASARFCRRCGTPQAQPA